MTIDRLLEQLQVGEDESERAEAARQLALYQDSRVIPALINALGDNDQWVQTVVSKSLLSLGVEAIPHLEAALRQPNEAIRWGAAEILAESSEPTTEQALRAALRDNSANVQGASARSLYGKITSEKTIQELQQLLDQPDAFPRYQALNTLHNFDPNVVNEERILQRDVTSGQPSDRSAALDYIRQHQKEEWLDTVERMLSDDNIGVRRAAEWTLQRLRSQHEE